MTEAVSPARPPRIHIAAAVIIDSQSRVLLVRKRGTRFFMQPGGKLHDGENDSQALARELNEELGCSFHKADFLGTFTAPAANEPAHIVEAALFRVEITGDINPRAEIEDVLWLHPAETASVPLAPLTQSHVLPLVLSHHSKKLAV
jgi:8-oxo-dGTP diphosphatase